MQHLSLLSENLNGETLLKIRRIKAGRYWAWICRSSSAVEFGKKRSVVGFDINQTRIDQLKAANDSTVETNEEELRYAKHLIYTTNPEDLKAANCFIVTVPTPIDAYKRPDLTPLIKAGENCR